MNTRIPCNFSEIFPYQREISYFSKGKIEHKNKISGLGKDCDHALFDYLLIMLYMPMFDCRVI